MVLLCFLVPLRMLGSFSFSQATSSEIKLPESSTGKLTVLMDGACNGVHGGDSIIGGR